MATAAITCKIAKLLIERDDNGVRFQRFCVDLMSEAEHVDYVSSAPSFDLGRDGRTALLTSGALDAVVCSSVKLSAPKAVAKAKKDLARLIETGLPRRVALCFNCELQETHKEQVRKYLRDERKINLRMRMEGVEFLSESATRHPEILEKHYGGELLALRQGLLADDTPVRSTANGLRIAMATQFGEDAKALRFAAMMNLVRLAARGRDWIKRESLREQISEDLGLVNRVNDAYLDVAIQQLESAKEVTTSGDSIKLTEAGNLASTKLDENARERLLNGRLTFQREVLQRLSTPLADAVFDDVWVRLQDALADLFMSDGMAIVHAILEPTTDRSELTGIENPLTKVAKSAIPAAIPTKEGLALGRVIIGVLTSETDTHAWLGQVAATFTAICSLGLHPEAQEELMNKLRSWSLLADTHVVISFLCTAESDHDGVNRVVGAWRKLGREATTCQAVLEEAAYHAHIAEYAWEEWWRQLHELSKDQVAALIPNAFLRSFHAVSGDGGYGPTRWQAFISNFRGSHQFDGSAISRHLVEKGWNVLGDTKFRAEKVRQLEADLTESASHSVRYDEHRKRHEWDARVALAALFRAKKKASSGGNVIIVTKSRAIRRAVEHFRKNSMGDLPIMSVGALGYAMSLTPGLSISLADIRELLFDRMRIAQAFAQLESAARRVAEHDRNEGFDLIGKPQMQRRLTSAVSEMMREIGESDQASNSGRE